jgi:hypothetical protein
LDSYKYGNQEKCKILATILIPSLLNKQVSHTQPTECTRNKFHTHTTNRMYTTKDKATLPPEYPYPISGAHVASTF